VFGEGGVSAVAYDVPSAQVLELICATASFDGSAIAAAWFPALVVESDSGHVVSKTVTGASVAAGGSADVTFAPFLSAPGGGGGGGFAPGAAFDDFGPDLQNAAADLTAGGWIVPDLDISALPAPPVGKQWAVVLIPMTIPL
jgi:hypothetical protein